MLGVITIRHVGLGLAMLLLTAASLGATATFRAPAPGADLKPLADAHLIIDLIQGQNTVLWSALSGPVTSVKTFGWPSSDNTHELGGALVIDQPAGRLAGVIDIGEKPMTVEFDVSG